MLEIERIRMNGLKTKNLLMLKSNAFGIDRSSVFNDSFLANQLIKLLCSLYFFM